MALNSIVNTIVCGGNGYLGTGLANCKFDFDNMSGGGVGLLKVGTDISAVASMAEFRALQVAGSFLPIQGIFNVEDQGSEDQFETSESGLEALSTKGLFKYKIDFTNGHMYHKVLASLEGNNRWEVIMWDAAGNLDLRETATGELRGYSTSHVTVGKPTNKSGGTTAKQSLIFQLSNRAQKDNQLSFINADKLDADGITLLELEGVNELEISLDPVVVGATSITGTLRSPFDNTLTETTLAVGDFTFTGAVPTAAVVSELGILTLTVPAVTLDDVITASITGVFENASNQLFKSNIGKVIVTA
tara:strand:- start:10370 stop:11278 length:909 start_codon:yes stop_codon:yes gene_type:complete